MTASARENPSDSEGNVVIGLSAVIVAVQDDEPKVFIVRGAEHALSAGVVPVTEWGEAPPFGPFDPAGPPTRERGRRTRARAVARGRHLAYGWGRDRGRSG